MASIYSAATATACDPVAAPPAQARSHLHYMENMRGITILLVIASHCFGLAWSGSPGSWFPSDPVLSFLSGATPVFVFISGFFFHHVFHGEFRYLPFLRKKARALLPPYLMVTVTLIAVQHAMGIDSRFYFGLRDPVAQFAMAAISGGSGPAMWYIPFLFDIFLLSPLFLLFAKAPLHRQLAVLGGLLVLGLLVDRSAFNRLGNLAHFSFYYALGIHCSLYRARFERSVRSDAAIFGAAAVILLLATAQYWFARAGEAGWLLPWDPIKFVYLRKIALIVLLSGTLLRFADRPLPGLTRIAHWSFGLFFVHQLPILLLMPVAASGIVAPGHGALVLYAGLVFAMSMAILWGVKRVCGPASRHLVGV